MNLEVLSATFEVEQEHSSALILAYPNQRRLAPISVPVFSASSTRLSSPKSVPSCSIQFRSLKRNTPGVLCQPSTETTMNFRSLREMGGAKQPSSAIKNRFSRVLQFGASSTVPSARITWRLRRKLGVLRKFPMVSWKQLGVFEKTPGISPIATWPPAGKRYQFNDN